MAHPGTVICVAVSIVCAACSRLIVFRCACVCRPNPNLYPIGISLCPASLLQSGNSALLVVAILFFVFVCLAAAYFVRRHKLKQQSDSEEPTGAYLTLPPGNATFESNTYRL